MCNSNVFGSCIIHILYTGCAKLKKKSGAKTLSHVLMCVILTYLVPVLFTFYVQGALKFKKKSGAKRLSQVLICVIITYLVPVLFTFYIQGVLKLKIFRRQKVNNIVSDLFKIIPNSQDSWQFRLRLRTPFVTLLRSSVT